MPRKLLQVTNLNADMQCTALRSESASGGKLLQRLIIDKDIWSVAMLRRMAQVMALAVSSVGNAVPLADLSGGQTGRIEFMASNPPHRWALIRGELGPRQAIYGDLLLPPTPNAKIPAVVMSHGSDGITEGMREVWAKPFLAAGYAVFMVDSFSPRDSAKIAGTGAQLTWNTTVNISDAIYALKLLTSHPKIDASRIFHLGWSRGGSAVTGAMWPNYRFPITQAESIKWAGSIPVYPGCNLRYRNPTLKVSAPVLYLFAEKDDMTPAEPCVEEVNLLAAEGNAVQYKVYPGAYHVFDRLNQARQSFREGTYARCAVDVVMPSHVSDRKWGPAFNRATKTTLETPPEWEAAVKDCAGTFWITSATDVKAREQAVKDALEFMDRTSRALAQESKPTTDKAEIDKRAEEILRLVNFK
ncbi:MULTISPECIES: dienelactone hydrolase family protein [unclassified Polaromonas]|jgi:dienelactone hydrolase|uniref:dienelactone hydrolase family protein n=1 Tax=unclassified Polaromonas TaxID=2638319 RepID=UPI000BCE1944|nr:MULTISPECIES: dienelactone hydrolase family protein [unclassified Polaromonas]OYY34815.1 MAG: hypothetical protein B7Y60_15370 [Polaromonas sp. 35-63-35]OYZ19300.1 MAG: hypothetical protein B7Y28_12225 [Polaromonas sp. 16-63-31]OYZ77576.1 MAG: hypothetical protein B7Y09_16530 [Polaromonas sp. 24-63-21]OZA48442.1 MAG: hypothetical protein B7X88_17990 [Polaromonas sp. 17-63-33]OZA87190.1 MAG: hypothetical protein B7X65_13460 [Polaromonas sp. 39-63-25]